MPLVERQAGRHVGARLVGMSSTALLPFACKFPKLCTSSLM